MFLCSVVLWVFGVHASSDWCGYLHVLQCIDHSQPPYYYRAKTRLQFALDLFYYGYPLGQGYALRMAKNAKWMKSPSLIFEYEVKWYGCRFCNTQRKHHVPFTFLNALMLVSWHVVQLHLNLTLRSKNNRTTLRRKAIFHFVVYFPQANCPQCLCEGFFLPSCFQGS